MRATPENVRVPVLFAGVDTDVHAIHLVLLEEEGADATYIPYRLDVGPGNVVAKAQRLPTVIPKRTAWAADNVAVIAIEEPFGNTFRGAVPLALIRGALLASLPRHDPPVVLIPPHEWKKWSLGGGFPGKGNARKDAIAAWVKDTWANRTTTDQNALDAFAIAWAARALFHEGDRRFRRTHLPAA